jgi:hypothetical protein
MEDNTRGDTGVSVKIILNFISKNGLCLGGLCPYDSAQNIAARPRDRGNVFSGFKRVDKFLHQLRDCQSCKMPLLWR